MPRNKRHIDREEKKEEILKAAARLFREQGFTSTSMSQVAASAGVAPNTVYWYFENKDDVLIAVLNSALEHGMQTLSIRHAEPLLERGKALLGLLEDYGSLVTTVHALLQESDAIREWHDRFHQIVLSIMTAELINHKIPEAEARKDAWVLMYVIEGLLAHTQSAEERELILSQTLYRIGIDQSAPAPGV